MKTLVRSILILFVWLSALANHSIYANEKDISLDKENKLIIAPEASAYEWYLDGVKLLTTERTVEIHAPGRYEVVMTGENGEVSISVITVGITAEGEVYTLYLIGDSTVCFYSSGWYPLTGWGMMLPYFFDSSVVIDNRAIGGRSAKSFYNDHWAPIRDILQPGDFVFIQFGINDGKEDDPARYSDPFTTFQDYLTSFVTETQEKGAFPVLVTTVRRNSWINDSTVYDAWHDYPVATRELAGELNVPLVDLDSLSVPLYQSLGPDYTGPFIYMHLEPGEYPNHPDGYSDDVHFQEVGATEMARLVIEAILKYSEDTIMNRLIPHIKPMHEVTTSTNFPEAALLTRTASYPEGIPVTLKAIIDPTYDLLEWQDGAGETLSTNDRYKFTMGPDTLSAIAILDDDPEPDCEGVLNGSAYYDPCGECVGGTTGILPCNSETSDGTYKMTSVRSKLCIQEGEDITQENCTSEYTQFWEFIKEGEVFKIRSLESGEYLSCENLASNSKVSTGTEEMLWRMEKLGPDTFNIVPKDNPDLILEVYGTYNPGIYLRLYDRTEGTNQQFVLWESDPETCSGYPCASAIEGSVQEASRFHIMPNPTSGSAILEFASVPEYPFTLEIYTMQGRRVYHQSAIRSSRFEFGQELSKGIYIVRIFSGKTYYSLKFIKY